MTVPDTVAPTLARRSLPAFLGWLERLGEKGRVHYDETQQCWHVLGHPEISTVLADPGTFSSDLRSMLPPEQEWDVLQRGNLVQIDPPRHRKLRTLVSTAFTPRTVAALAPRIAAVTNDLLDATAGNSRVDLIDDLAYPLPVIVIAEMLGIPPGDRPVFRRWADTIFERTFIDPTEPLTTSSQKAVQAFAPALLEMNSYLCEHINARRARPAEDLTSRLIQAEVDGQQLDDEEISGMLALLLFAGHITTTATLGNTIVTLSEHPATAAELRADPGLLPAAIEEVLRYRTPFPRLTRQSTTQVELHGVDLPAGAIVVPWVAAANRDERIFTEPARFDIHRRPNPHLTFGHGIHFCLGAPLARMEARIALEILFQRYSRISLADGVEQRDPWTMISPTRLPVEVRAA